MQLNFDDMYLISLFNQPQSIVSQNGIKTNKQKTTKNY